MTEPYVVGLTADGADASGETIFGDIGLERLTAAGLQWRLLPEIPAHGPVDPSSLDGVDAVVSFGHIPFDAELVRRAPRLRHVARFGAGYDGIDPQGLASEGVLLTTAPQAVRAPMALSAVTLVLACAHRLVENHMAASTGRWVEERGRHRGIGVHGRVAGIVGFGSVGSLVAEQLQGLGMTVIALDRPSARERAAELDVELVDLGELARRSDVVVVTAALTAASRHLVDEAFLAQMRPTAYLVNVARGGLVDQAALTVALQEGRIAGAALDVLEPEPPSADDPLLRLPTVIVTPHALCWTADFTREVSTSVIDSVIAASRGVVPETALADPGSEWRGAAS
jgi:phosphoglycerate dehydrogenase-like enzyme